LKIKEKLHNEELRKLLLLNKYNYIDQAKADGLDKACNTYKGEKECIVGSGGKAVM
jgi:hypothetical protein